MLAEGHLLIQDVPGVAKTMLARALAVSAGCSFQRIQCMPDLQPTDVLGGPYLDPQSGGTEFRFGPLFSQLVLVDEINRASPRTQAAMLEAMGEGMITWRKSPTASNARSCLLPRKIRLNRKARFLCRKRKRTGFWFR